MGGKTRILLQSYKYNQTSNYRINLSIIWNYQQAIILLIILCIILFWFLVPGCNNVALVGDGFCNDKTNNQDCNYDGGDCCVVNANTNTCSECVCHFLDSCVVGYNPLVGNGFCDDDTNIAECGYDGGDCLPGNAICSLMVCLPNLQILNLIWMLKIIMSNLVS